MVAQPKPDGKPKRHWGSVSGAIRCEHCRNGKVNYRVWTGRAWRDLPVNCPACNGDGWLWPRRDGEQS